MNDRLLSFLGICRRAKKLVIGAETAVASMTDGKPRVVRDAADFSKGSVKAVTEASGRCGVEALALPRTKEELSLALGRLSGVLSVEDKGFADKLRELINSEQRGEFDENKG